VKTQIFLMKTVLGKIKFLSPWRVCFTCLNSRLTTRHPKISNGSFKSSFRAREGSQKSPTILGIIFQTNFRMNYLIANIWLQLGWRPPCEVSKNLADLVPLVLGMESFSLYNLSSGYSPKFVVIFHNLLYL
jgi:hypothetical protein